MARPLPPEFAGAFYHVTARGDGREDIVLCDAGRPGFLVVLGEIAQRIKWTPHAYCLMSIRHHLPIERPDANLSSAMLQLHGVYTQNFNRSNWPRRGWTNSLAARVISPRSLR